MLFCVYPVILLTLWGRSNRSCSDVAALKYRLPTGARVARRIMSRYLWDTPRGIQRFVDVLPFVTLPKRVTACQKMAEKFSESWYFLTYFFTL
jgi:hypothetical protein